MSKGSKMKRKKSKGFTLIELLVVVAIVGILAAIAIPQFAAYRARGFNARVSADTRNAATANEAYFVDYNAYATSGGCTALPGFNPPPDAAAVDSLHCFTASRHSSYSLVPSRFLRFRYAREEILKHVEQGIRRARISTR